MKKKLKYRIKGIEEAVHLAEVYHEQKHTLAHFIAQMKNHLRELNE